MRISINTSKWYDPIWAAFLFFTRLPLWKVYQPPKDSYQRVVEYWPLTGWLTGGMMATVVYLGQWIFPFPIALILAFILRLVLTGALHEDGLADFADGLGGGFNNKQRILEIMKDSHIGTYGVLTLIMYYALLFSTLYALGPHYAPWAILVADPFSKMVAGQITQFLPYARHEEDAKSRIVYRKFTTTAALIYFAQGILPFILLIYTTQIQNWNIPLFTPCLIMFFLYLYLNKKIQGYTGDCCGAIFLLTELSMYLSILWSLG